MSTPLATTFPSAGAQYWKRHFEPLRVASALFSSFLAENRAPLRHRRFPMQQQPPRQRAGSGLHGADFSFEARVDNEEQLVDSMLGALARGALPAEAWERLHAAGQRDGRLSELAFAFESVSQGKRAKTVQPPLAAEFLFQAGRFFSGVFGDELGGCTRRRRRIDRASIRLRCFGVRPSCSRRSASPTAPRRVRRSRQGHRLVIRAPTTR